MPNLVLVNDPKLRLQAFGQAAKLLRQLDRLETDIESFHGRDARLFHDWYELTFREQKLALEALHEEHRQLARFHNWMVALAEMQDYTLRAAYRFLQNEEKRYQTGSAGERLAIEEERRLRDEFIRVTMEREDREARGERVDADDDDDDGDDDDERASEESDLSADARAADNEELQAIAEMSDEEVRNWCASSEVAFDWLARTLRHARGKGDSGPFFRVWDLTPEKIQTLFAKFFRQSFGTSLYDLIEILRQSMPPPPAAPRASSEQTAEAEAKSQAETPLGKENALKQLYRRLARKLHPDLLEGKQGQSPWQKSIWLRAQSAYGRKDVRELERLFRFVLLRGRELNDLLLSEIRDSHDWLRLEIAQTKASIKGLRRSPAWGFSRRKDFGPIQRKLEKELQNQRLEIEDRIIDLKMRHEDF